VFPNDCDNDRQPEIAIWQPKLEVLISIWNYDRQRRNFNGKSGVFNYDEFEESAPNDRDNDLFFSGHIAISGPTRSLWQSLGATFLEIVVIKNLKVSLVNDHIICFLVKHVGAFMILALHKSFTCLYLLTCA